MAGDLDGGREEYSHGAWVDAHASLARADRTRPLEAEDVERLARAAYMLGRDDEYVAGLERAQRAHLEAGDAPRAARCAFWIGHNLMFRGESALAAGWFARAQRLLERAELECVERGYLMIPELLAHSSAGDFDAAYAVAVDAAAIGDRFGDDDLVAIALMEQGHALVRQGRAAEGLRLMDETMVAVTSGELSPIVAGIVYCNTIAFCRDVYEVRRARDWTAALTRWCAQQPGMVAHNGLCLVHRAEIMTLRGEWPDALDEARRVAERFHRGVLNQRALGHAEYRQGEVHRLQGELVEAEAAYREASRLGRDPQPGLALMRLTKDEPDAAAAAIRRALDATSLPIPRAALLPAFVEIMLAVGDLAAAEAAAGELEGIASRQGGDGLAAMSLHARGAVALAAGDPGTALVVLREAGRAWQDIDAPYEAARVRVLASLACRALGDDEAAALELDAARDVFARLGAVPDLTRLDGLAGGGRRAAGNHGLTARELEVLRLVAAGKSNRAIAADLVISDHTVRRHLQNIFRKLGVSSRSAATSFAFQHDLI